MEIGRSFDNVELKSLARKVPEVLKSSVSENTYKSYTFGFKKWLKWSKKFKFKPFPVNTLRKFLNFFSNFYLFLLSLHEVKT